MPEPISLYVHIPFCATRCTYCAFNTYAGLESLIPALIMAICEEIKSVSVNSPHTDVGTIYFGGGTPSLLSPAQFEGILACVQRHFRVMDDAEISIESNPNDLSVAYLRALRELGINRLSIGMQSANKRELALFARRHTHEATIEAVKAARDSGLVNLNLDLIYGFPRQTLKSWTHSLMRLIELAPEHVSLYALGVEPGTPFALWIEQGNLPEVDDDLAADMYDLATDMMQTHGYKQYEISNWSLPGYACQHNLQYWRNQTYLGFGPGAHGFAAGVRYATLTLPGDYIRVMSDCEGMYFDFPRSPATQDAQLLSKDDEIGETLMMALRLTEEGLLRESFQKRFGVDVMALKGVLFRRFVQDGLLEILPDKIRLTERGRLLSNIVFRELI